MANRPLLRMRVFMISINKDATYPGGWDSSVGGTLDSWSESRVFNIWQERQDNFLLRGELPVLTLIHCLFHPCVTAADILPKVQVAGYS